MAKALMTFSIPYANQYDFETQKMDYQVYVIPLSHTL
jgi:hypothetical protein